MKGRWRDKFEYANGHVEYSPWKSNQIQNLAATMAAALFRRAGEMPTWSGFTGISYMAIGSGDVAWDTIPPTLDPADTTLENEYFRKSIAAADMYFIDPVAASPAPPLGVLSRAIGISVTLLPGEANGSLREFGLFGGLATGAADSGTILNWVSHGLITKDITITLTRTVELEFLLP
jgi:hypothetical protein